jgi:hypothetical protein
LSLFFCISLLLQSLVSLFSFSIVSFITSCVFADRQDAMSRQ